MYYKFVYNIVKNIIFRFNIRIRNSVKLVIIFFLLNQIIYIILQYKAV